MGQASIVINVSDVPHVHSNGLSGTYTVPAKPADEDFGILVVYPGYEVQDIGDKRTTQHHPKSLTIARDIVGLNSDAAAHSVGSPGTKEKWGLRLCEVGADLPQELLDAIDEEIAFLNANPPDVKQKYDPINRINVAVNIEADSVKEQKVDLSEKVEKLRRAFEKACRKLVKPADVEKARAVMHHEDQRLISEADQMHAQGERTRENINELHKAACRRMGQTRPWCYTPEQLVDCPGCGTKIKENVLSCASCGGWLDEGLDVLRAMKPKERAQKMYPERYAEPMTAGGKK